MRVHFAVGENSVHDGHVSPLEFLQVEIAHPAESVPASRWRNACRLALGLDEASADTLRTRTPATVHLALEGEAAIWRQRLERDLGARVVLSRLGNAPRCTSHRAALISERCPRCESLSACGLCRAATHDGLCASCIRSLRRRRIFRNVRVAVLLAILGAVAFGTLATGRRLHRWVAPLSISLVPIAADGSRIESLYLASLGPDAFADVAHFLESQGARYHRDLGQMIDVHLEKPIAELPPAPPEPGSSALDVAKWSLQLRYWNWDLARRQHFASADIRIYVAYHAVLPGQALDASIGLEKGHIGIVQAPIGDANQGWVELAVAHELLHTLGATDKYDESGAPLVDQGFGEPELSPALPQRYCEVMAGSIALEAGKNKLARSLDECLVNRYTAAEIGWLAK